MTGEVVKARLFLYTYNSDENRDTNQNYPIKIFVDDRVVFDEILIDRDREQTTNLDSFMAINVIREKKHTITVELKGTDISKKIEQRFNRDTILVIFYNLKDKDLVVKTLQDKIKVKIDFLNELYFQKGDSLEILVDDELVFDRVSFGKNKIDQKKQQAFVPRLTLEIKKGIHSITIKSKKNSLIGKIEQIFNESGTLHISYTQNNEKNNKKDLMLNFD